MKIPPTPTSSEDIRSLISVVATSAIECKLWYRNAWTVYASVADESKGPEWKNIVLHVSDERSVDQKYRSRTWVLPSLTRMERYELKKYVVGIMLPQWKRLQKLKPDPRQLSLFA